MSLDEFREQLSAKLQEVGLAEDDVRPFVCTGSPLACEIMMVGFNPSRNVDVELFDPRIWNDETGFDREQFVEYYDLAGYQQDESKWSRNHIFQQNLIDELPTYPVLETYLYSSITPKKGMLSNEQRRTDIFDWLVDIVQPKLIVTQNSDVSKYFERITGQILTRNAFNTVNYRDHLCVILPISHLSKKWTFSEVASLRESILTLLSLIESPEALNQAHDEDYNHDESVSA